MRLWFEAKSKKGCGSFCPFTKEILSCILPGSVWKNQQQHQPEMVIVKTFAILLVFPVSLPFLLNLFLYSYGPWKTFPQVVPLDHIVL